MYLHPQHQFTDPQALHALIASHPLGAWVCQVAQGLSANHIPFVLDRQRGPQGTLIGHVSRANPVWRELQPGAPSVVMFQGPQHYITPGWYPGKAEHGQVVPTWNYAVVHAHGEARAIEDRAGLLDLLNRLTDQQEAQRPQPWRVGDAPAPFIEQMLRGIVGIEIPLTQLIGKLKVSQDEALADRWGTVRGLQQDGSESAQAMAALVHQAIEPGLAGPA